MVFKSLKHYLLVAITFISFGLSAQTFTYNLTGRVASGPFAGEIGTGYFSYSDTNGWYIDADGYGYINAGSASTNSNNSLRISFTIFGQTFTERSDDLYFTHGTPQLILSPTGEPVFLDYFVADIDAGGHVDIINPNVLSFTSDINGNNLISTPNGYEVTVSVDEDGDAVPYNLDNCPLVANPDQADKDNNGVGDACEPPRLTGIWPGNANTGDTISLFVFGDYFDMAPGATQVFVNGIQQFIVQVVTPEMLIVRLTVTPAMIGGPITVTTSNGSAASSTNFGVISAGLQITGIWPSTVTEGVTDSVFVFGSEFDLAPGVTEVYFNTERQWIAQVVTPDMIIVRTTPTIASSGPVFVTTPAGTAVSGINLMVVP